MLIYYNIYKYTELQSWNVSMIWNERKISCFTLEKSQEYHSLIARNALFSARIAAVVEVYGCCWNVTTNFKQSPVLGKKMVEWKMDVVIFEYSKIVKLFLSIFEFSNIENLSYFTNQQTVNSTHIYINGMDDKWQCIQS